MGQKLHQIFIEFQEAGFTEDQAFELTKAVLFAYPFVETDHPKETPKNVDINSSLPINPNNINYATNMCQLQSPFYDQYAARNILDSLCSTNMRS